MPIQLEDDFGTITLRSSLRASGFNRPRHCIGSTLGDLPFAAQPPSGHEHRTKGCMDLASVHCADGFTARRLMGAVHDRAGDAVYKNRTSVDRPVRAQGVLVIDAPVRPRVEGSKRCFPWTHRVTDPLGQLEAPPPSARGPASGSGLLPSVRVAGGSGAAAHAERPF
mmetsp:Transcript_16556/g.58006  ORF Transcript_16556/g.58006 Transcript_16556/m.58006 type:complete len:167 (+) Transcript_16556:69-569(+)